jgi:hypothetical protein
MASINHGRPLRQEAPRSPALVDLAKVVHTLFGPERPAPTKPAGGNTGGISKIFKRFGLKT